MRELGDSPEVGADAISVCLSAAEAMTVVAALRQYEPYWRRMSEQARDELLSTIREQVESVIGKVRTAAG